MSSHKVLWNMLEEFDWLFEMSDSHTKWVAGSRQDSVIKAFIANHPETEPLYKQYKDHIEYGREKPKEPEE